MKLTAFILIFLRYMHGVHGINAQCKGRVFLSVSVLNSETNERISITFSTEFEIKFGFITLSI
jgi:hypothetical protein